MACTSKPIYHTGIMNLEHERRKELERRKKLRLLQVRQQSKEFADKLREKVKEEIIQERKKYLSAETKLKQERHLKELSQLKEFYKKCIESIGEGHREAAKQPDMNMLKQTEMARASARASKRGTKAIKKQFEDETIQKQKIEEPVKQKKATRNKENLRAFFISSLPKHADKSGPLSLSPKTSHQSCEPLEARRVLEEIPSNLPGAELRLQDTQKQNTLENFKRDLEGREEEQFSKHRSTEVAIPTSKPKDRVSNVSSPRDCSCDYIVCFCHRSPGNLRRCSSELKIREKCLDFEEPGKKKVRSRSCSPRSVRTLNYLKCGNVYESNQQSSVRVTHHSRSPKITEEPVPNTVSVQEVSVSKPSLEELKKRTDKRSAKACRQEQLKRDFQQLVQNLKKLTQEKSKTKRKLRVFSSERDIRTRNETKQKKLNDAYEKLPHNLKSIKTQDTGTGTQNASQIPNDDSTPPTLNLALCQTNMAPTLVRRVVSTDDTTILSSNSPSSPSKRTKSSPRGHRDGSPNVVVNRDPSGDVHITVKVSEVLSGRSKPTSPTSDSSYMSPPTNVTPSQQQILEALLCQVNKRAIGNEMKEYIKRLLSMSRESIDNLRGPGSGPDQSETLDEEIEQDLARLNELAEVYAEKVNTLVCMYEQMSSSSSTPYVDPIRAPPRESPAPNCIPTPTSMTPSPRPRRGVPPSSGGFRTPSPAQTRSTPRSSGSASSADTFEMLFAIPGQTLPSREEVARRVAQFSSPSPDFESCGDATKGDFRDEEEKWFKIDTSFNISALQFPLNSEKLIALKKTLAADICNNQYREIIKELHKDTGADQLQLENIWKTAADYHFLDTNATLAPVNPVHSSYTGSDSVMHRLINPPGNPSSSGFYRTGRTSSVDKRLPTGFRESPNSLVEWEWELRTSGSQMDNSQ